MSGLKPGHKGLDDDHSAAAAGAGMLRYLLFVGLLFVGLGLIRLGACSFDGINRNDWRQRELFAGARNVVGTLAACEHSIIADAVETGGQNMHQETADELVGRERHHFVTLGAFDSVVLLLKGDALLIAGDQAPVGDGDPMSVAGEITQDFLGSSKRALAVDDPFALA